MRSKLVTVTMAISLLVTAAFLFWVYQLHQEERQIIRSKVTASPEEVGAESTAEKLVMVDVDFKNIRDMDIRKGSYAMETIVDYYGQKDRKLPELNLNDANVSRTKVLNWEDADSDLIKVQQQVLSGHLFTPVNVCFPLDTQVITYDIISKARLSGESLWVQNVTVNKTRPIEGYKVIETGSVGKLVGLTTKDKQLVSRAYVIIQHNSFFAYIMQYQLLLIAILLSGIVVFCPIEGYRFMASMAILFVAMSTVGAMLTKVGDSAVTNFVEVTGIYYSLAFVTFFILIAIYYRNQTAESKLTDSLVKLADELKELARFAAISDKSDKIEALTATFQKEEEELRKQRVLLKEKNKIYHNCALTIVTMTLVFFVSAFYVVTL